MSFLRHISPRGAVADIVEVWRQPTPYRWQILGLAVAMTFTLMVLMIPESQRVEPRRPHVTYITTFDETRTDAEIIASNIENQKLKEKREAEAQARLERKKEAYRALGRATGIDVDAMEEKIKREQAEESARAAATRQNPQQAVAAAVEQ